MFQPGQQEAQLHDVLGADIPYEPHSRGMEVLVPPKTEPVEPEEDTSSSSSSSSSGPAERPKAKAKGVQYQTQVQREAAGKDWWSSAKITRSKTRPNQAQRRAQTDKTSQRLRV